ncbi:DUF805 domain-containing protein [Ligilactobacillus pabuli]|uniref:DUF805 domain-containing protein n=1 Tax=Ligilactobacillus pabuli TaxID=2886039 RepID=UPI001FBAEA82|nr:DUF805 domain-containing protein [Ligilactobacillus pabuli]
MTNEKKSPLVATFYKNSFNFLGKTNRDEFRRTSLYVLFMLIAILFLSFVTLISLLIASKETRGGNSESIILIFVGIFLIFFLPLISLVTRRFRDIGLHGRGFFVLLITIFLAQILLSEMYDPDFLFYPSYYLIALLALWGMSFSLPSDSLLSNSPNVFLRFMFRSKSEKEHH